MKDLIKMLIEQVLDELDEKPQVSFEETNEETQFGNTELSLHLIDEDGEIAGYSYAIVGYASSMVEEMESRGLGAATWFNDIAEDAEDDRVAYFGSVEVEKESLRGQGLGRQLLDNMLETIETYDPALIVLNVMPSAFMNADRWMHSLTNRGFKKVGLTTMIKQSRNMHEINAIGVGGGALQSSGKISGTGGNPLGRDMSKDHERMWSGDEEGSDRVTESIQPEKIIWLSINELEANSFQGEDEFYSGHVDTIADVLKDGWDMSVVPPITAYASSPKWIIHDGHHRWLAAKKAGLGKVPVLNYLAMSRGEKSSHARRIKAWRKHITHPFLGEERIGSRGSVQYFQMGSSLPDHLYNLDSKGRATRDPGLGGNTDKKKKNKREKKKKDSDRPGKRWYDK